LLEAGYPDSVVFYFHHRIIDDQRNVSAANSDSLSRLQQRPTSANDRRPKSSQLVKLECIDDSTLFLYFKIRRRGWQFRCL